MRLVFDRRAFEGLAWWLQADMRKAKRVVELIQETARTRKARAWTLILASGAVDP